MPKAKRAGRPSAMTPEVVRKLEEGFSRGLSDREACLYAGIAPSTLYSYCEKHKRFSERKELLKEQTKLQAKLVIAEAIASGDLKAAQWYLERKAREEFSLRYETETAITSPVTIIADFPREEASRIDDTTG